MRFITYSSLLLACLWAGLCPGSTASADVQAGEIIDESNWEKVEGMIPGSVLNWIKKGDYTLKVDDLEYDPKAYMTNYDKEHFEPNKGKYEFDDEGVIMEVKGGKPADFIQGIPFPEIGLDDPKAGAKIATNHYYHTFTEGNISFPFQFRWVGRTGLERSVEAAIHQYPMDGYPPRKEVKNKENIERYSILQIVAPYDIAGTNMLLWRYRDARPDSTFAYVPAIRRVRRMSPANRSDSWIGADICADDAWCIDGKVSSFTWKLLRKQDGLLPYMFKKVQPIEKSGGEMCATTQQTPCWELNYETNDAQTAPWFPTEKNKLVWAKRPVYVVELKAKDPYYNYGKQRIWVDAENAIVVVMKDIYDRADEYWKCAWMVWSAVRTDDGSVKAILPGYMVAVDERTDHCTMLQGYCKDYIWKIYDDSQKERNYSLAGFQRLAK